jgi:hypothetical protein
MVTCKSTRYGPGCGHPVEDHTGNGPCCCCNRLHNDPRHVNDCASCQQKRLAGISGYYREANAHTSQDRPHACPPDEVTP